MNRIGTPIVRTALLIALGLVASTALAQSGDLGPRSSSDWAVPSPDGTKIAYASDAQGSTSIWIANRDGSDARPLQPWLDAVQTEPDWSPDGTTLAFASNRDAQRCNIWLIGVDGSNPRQLTASAGENRQPRFAPNGAMLAFTSRRTGKRELWLMNSDGTNQRAVGLQSLLVSDPAWSPDSRRLVYSGCKRPAAGGALTDMVCNLFIITLDASATLRLTSGNFMDSGADWSAGGIAFSSNRNGSFGVWTVAQDGSALRQITQPRSAIDLHPKWDRSSSTVVFARGNEIWGTSSDGSERQLVRANAPPDCSTAVVDPASVWPPNHKLVRTTISGISDPDGDPVSLVVTGIRQDEPVGDGGADGAGVGTANALVRAERDGNGNGRVYEISFTASDSGGQTCGGAVEVAVPHDRSGSAAVDDGAQYDATQP